MSIKSMLVQAAIVATAIIAIDCQIVDLLEEITPDYEVTTAPCKETTPETTASSPKPYLYRIAMVLRSNFGEYNYSQCALHCANDTSLQWNDILVVLQEVSKECIEEFSDFSSIFSRIKEAGASFVTNAIDELVDHGCHCKTVGCYKSSYDKVKTYWNELDQILRHEAVVIHFHLQGNKMQACAAASRKLRNFE